MIATIGVCLGALCYAAEDMMSEHNLDWSGEQESKTKDANEDELVTIVGAELESSMASMGHVSPMAS